jgi:hypothetical protein
MLIYKDRFYHVRMNSMKVTSFIISDAPLFHQSACMDKIENAVQHELRGQGGKQNA